MFLLIAISVAISIYIIFIKITNQKFEWWLIFTAIFIWIYLWLLWTDVWCWDWWISWSIWKQWACSHHGWVVQSINAIGFIVLWISIVINIFWYIKYNKNEEIRIQKEKEENLKFIEEQNKVEREKRVKYNTNFDIINTAIEWKRKIWFDYTNNQWESSHKQIRKNTK